MDILYDLALGGNDERVTIAALSVDPTVQASNDDNIDRDNREEEKVINGGNTQ